MHFEVVIAAHRLGHAADAAGEELEAALALHGFTGIQTLPALSSLPNLGIVGLPIAWFLDALATATLIYFGSHTLGTLSWGAAKGYFAAQEFKASLTNADEKQKD